MAYLCPLNNKPVVPKECLKKIASRPIIGMTDLFLNCRTCGAHWVVEEEPTSTIRQDSPITHIGDIECKVPIPKVPRKGVVSFTSYPFAKMNVGDSFFVKAKSPNLVRRCACTLSCAAAHFRKKKQPDWKFVTRQTKDGARIWRVE